VTRVVGRRVDVGAVHLWVEEHGPLDATPVLLVHRMAAQGFEWEPAFIEALVAAGYRAVTYDHRGFGWSDPGPTDRPLSFQDLVDDARGVLVALGITSAHLVGSSVGGVMARCVALQAPGLARSLTFIGSSPGDGTLPVWSPEYAEVANHPPGPTRTERVEYLVRELRVMSDARFDEHAARRRAERAVDRGWTLDALRRTARAAKGRSQGERDLAQLASISVPVLVVHGTGDHVLGLEHGRRLAAAIPGAELLVVEGMGHDVQEHHVPAIGGRMIPIMALGDRAAAS
jgi:pimeloyl-ACP methyl ester carboxylesterase